MRLRALSVVCLLAIATTPLFAQTLKEKGFRAPNGPAATIPMPMPEAAPKSAMPSERPIVPDALGPVESNGTNGLSLVGFISYSANVNTGIANLHADRVENTNTTRTSGTLRLTLWMSTGGYRQTGYRTAIYTMGTLNPNSYYAPVDSGNVTFTTPPTGCYFVSMLLEEFQSGGSYAYVDYLDFSNKASINGGCTVSTACTFSLSSPSGTVGATGGTGTVTVTSGPAGCTGTWSSSPNAAWLTVNSGGSGSGPGTTTLTYGASANTAPATRSGTITIAGNTFTVNQAAAATPGCTASSTALCLSTNSRFKVTATWQTSGGQTGTGQTVPLTSDTGYMWFFGPSNVEMVVKVIDACTFNNRFWVFAGGLTDVNVNLTVTDTKTGTVKTYTNPLGIAFQPIQDTNAFTCP